MSKSNGDGNNCQTKLNVSDSVASVMPQYSQNTSLQHGEKTNQKSKQLVQQVFHKSMFTIEKEMISTEQETMTPDYEYDDGQEMEVSTHTEPTVPWQTVPILRRVNPAKKRKTTSPTATIKTQNRYQDLPNDENEESTTKKEPRPPPVKLYGIQDVTKLQEFLRTGLEDGSFIFDVKTKQELFITFKDIQTYKKAMQLIRAKGLIGHTFSPKSERPFRLVIKNLHPSPPKEEIQTTIENTGNSVTGEIINAHYGPEKIKTHTWFVNLVPGPNNNKAKDIKSIYHTKVTMEYPRKQTTVVQCKRCQQYGHTKNHCMRPFRCVKCAENHKTSECMKVDRSTPAKCALCLGDHPANFKGCQVYLEIEKRKSGRVSKRTETPIIRNNDRNAQNRNSNAYNNVTKYSNGRTYAETLRNENPQHPSSDQAKMESPKVNPSIIELLTNQAQKTDLLLQQISTLLNLMTTIIQKLSN